MSNPETKAELRKYIGNKIRNLRKNANLTQLELSEKIDITTNSLGIYERGSRTPDIDVLLKIAEYFNLSLDELCGNVSKNTESKSKVYKLETVGDLARIIIALNNVCEVEPIYKATTVLDDETEKYYSENYGGVIDKVIESILGDHLSPEEAEDNIHLIDTTAGFIFSDKAMKGVGNAIQKFSERFFNAKEVREKLKDMGDEYATDVYNTLLNKAIEEASKTYFTEHFGQITF